MYLSHPLICPARIILLNSLFNILFNLRRVESLRRPVLRAAVGSHVWTSDSIVSLFDVFVINLFLFFSSEANYLLPSAHLHNVRVVLSCSFANQAVLIDVYDCRGENFKGLSVKPWTRIIVWQEGSYKWDLSATHPHVHRNLRHQTRTCESLPPATSATGISLSLSCSFRVVFVRVR